MVTSENILRKLRQHLQIWSAKRCFGGSLEINLIRGRKNDDKHNAVISYFVSISNSSTKNIMHKSNWKWPICK